MRSENEESEPVRASGEFFGGSHERGNHEMREVPDSEDWREWVEAAATFFRAGALEEPAAEEDADTDAESVDRELPVAQSPSVEVAESESESSRFEDGGRKEK